MRRDRDRRGRPARRCEPRWISQGSQPAWSRVRVTIVDNQVLGWSNGACGGIPASPVGMRQQGSCCRYDEPTHFWSVADERDTGSRARHTCVSRSAMPHTRAAG